MGLEDNRDETPSQIGEVVDNLNRDLFEDGKDGFDHASEQFNNCVEMFEQRLRSFFLWFITAMLVATTTAFIVSAYYVLSEGITYGGRVVFFLCSTVSCALSAVIAVRLFQIKKDG